MTYYHGNYLTYFGW